MPQPIEANGKRLNLLPTLSIGGAVSATATTPITNMIGVKYLIATAVFLYGAGGTTVKAYVQTSFDGGATWIDIMCFAFTTSAGTKVSAVTLNVALAASTVTTDGSMSDNTILNGLLGDQFRVKYVTTGTYTGATSLAVSAIAKG